MPEYDSGGEIPDHREEGSYEGVCLMSYILVIVTCIDLSFSIIVFLSYFILKYSSRQMYVQFGRSGFGTVFLHNLQRHEDENKGQ